MFITRYKPVRSTLSDSRTPYVNTLIRRIVGSGQQHVLISGKVGSGRHSLANALLQLGPTIKRRHCLKLDTALVATSLYEPLDTTEFFAGLRQTAKSYAGGLLLIDNVDLLIDSIERHEARRLARFFTELLEPNDIRCLVIASEDQAVTLLGLTPTMAKLFGSLVVPPLDQEETHHILSSELSADNKREVTELVARFYPERGLPGGALQLVRDASEMANQQGVALDTAILHQTVSEQRQLPLAAISRSNLAELASMEATLNQRVIGQAHAVTAVTRTIQRSHAGLAPQHRPIASFLFLGPSGVGKTELAKALADQLYKSPRAFTRIDMSEFSEAHTVQRLIGSPPGYVGYEEGGQLTNPVDREPYSLILLDEIEKAHPKVFDIFLQLLDDGRLTDGRGKTVNFEHTVVVATSNIGLHEIVQGAQSGALGQREDFLRRTLLPLLVEHFRPEFLNRFDALIAFGPLETTDLARIGRKQIDQLQERLKHHQIGLTVSDERLAALAARAYQPTFGARPMRRLIQEEIEAPIAQQLVTGSLVAGMSITV